MAHLPDGPLGPQLRELGFERLGDMTEPATCAYMLHGLDGEPFRELEPSDKGIVEVVHKQLRAKHGEVPGLPIFLRFGRHTLLVDADGQVWYINEFVDITWVGCTELTEI